MSKWNLCSQGGNKHSYWCQWTLCSGEVEDSGLGKVSEMNAAPGAKGPSEILTPGLTGHVDLGKFLRPVDISSSRL